MCGIDKDVLPLHLIPWLAAVLSSELFSFNLSQSCPLLMHQHTRPRAAVAVRSQYHCPHLQIFSLSGVPGSVDLAAMCLGGRAGMWARAEQKKFWFWVLVFKTRIWPQKFASLEVTFFRVFLVPFSWRGRGVSTADSSPTVHQSARTAD